MPNQPAFTLTVSITQNTHHIVITTDDITYLYRTFTMLDLRDDITFTSLDQPHAYTVAWHDTSAALCHLNNLRVLAEKRELIRKLTEEADAITHLCYPA